MTSPIPERRVVVERYSVDGRPKMIAFFFGHFKGDLQKAHSFDSEIDSAHSG